MEGHTATAHCTTSKALHPIAFISHLDPKQTCKLRLQLSSSSREVDTGLCTA
jgi:hypothetical protein